MLRHRQQQKKPDPLMNEMAGDKPPWLAHLSRDYRRIEDKVVSSVPLPGLAFKHDIPFEWPCCFYAIAITSRNQWAKHVLHDLMAYQCVYPDYLECDRWFTTSVEWREYQWRDHGQETVCPLCKKEARYFVLEDHIATNLKVLRSSFCMRRVLAINPSLFLRWSAFSDRQLQFHCLDGGNRSRSLT